MAPVVPIEYSGKRESIRCFKKMGKSRKVSKTHSSSIVPDYRHTMDRMTESEGFGNSVRLDTEMTASDNSCAPKRKCINLNERDWTDRFSVPIRVLSLSSMSRLERKDLQIKLKDELERVRVLQRRLASLNSSAMVISPANDIHSCTNGQKRTTPMTSIQSLPAKEATVTPGKKKNHPVRNGPRTKGLHVKRETVTQTLKETNIMPPNANNYVLMNQCQTLLNRMMAHDYGWVFNEPVDIVKCNVPDYFNVIKHPMDLGTVKKKLLSGQYLDPLGFAADVRLTFSNAMTYNPQGNDVHQMSKFLSKFFELRWKAIEKKIPTFPNTSKSSSVIVEAEASAPLPPLKKAKVTPLENVVKLENKVREEPVQRVMTDIERQKLGTELESLTGDLPDNILDFLKKTCSNNGSQGGENEIELDLDALSDDTLFMLQKLLNDHIIKQNLSKPTRQAEATNESGFNNSFLLPQKENEPAEEEVDIGGYDLPSSSFPPVKIEKDSTTHRNGRCSSSSSSSSDSGSSSSDSDSGSSPGSESERGKDSRPVITSKESLIPTENQEHKTGLPVDQETEDTIDVLTQQNQGSSLVPAEPDYHQDDENGPPERQPHNTIYRAALLRSRFADTIIKAQEKTLDKGEKLDPEKLRIEREELERRRREEKARLQAEAKAAEDAQRKAEEEAAAKARRKIELEREAARQALQKMEKTVDINENSRYMEDLDMFRVAPVEHLLSFTEEASPDHSQKGLGSFKFPASSNPLEQLGLYMKPDDDDEEEEQEAEPHSLPSNDPEEGEID